MAQQLLFNGLAIGDNFLKVEPINVTLTPPVRRTGLFQDFSAVNTDSRNLLYGQRFFATLERIGNIELNQAISLIQELQGLTGRIEVTADPGALGMVCEGWTIDIVSPPNLPEGYAGRFARQLVITGIGDTAPQYA